MLWKKKNRVSGPGRQRSSEYAGSIRNAAGRKRRPCDRSPTRTTERVPHPFDRCWMLGPSAHPSEIRNSEFPPSPPRHINGFESVCRVHQPPGHGVVSVCSSIGGRGRFSIRIRGRGSVRGSHHPSTAVSVAVPAADSAAVGCHCRCPLHLPLIAAVAIKPGGWAGDLARRRRRARKRVTRGRVRRRSTRRRGNRSRSVRGRQPPAADAPSSDCGDSPSPVARGRG